MTCSWTVGKLSRGQPVTMGPWCWLVGPVANSLQRVVYGHGAGLITAPFHRAEARTFGER
jgi:hypothetical protein